MVSLCKGLCQREDFQKLHEMTKGLGQNYKRPKEAWENRDYMHGYKRCGGCEMFFRGPTVPANYISQRSGLRVIRFKCPCCGGFARTTKRNGKRYDMVRKQVEERRIPFERTRNYGIKNDIIANIGKWNALIAN
jgi:hypothetical protein